MFKRSFLGLALVAVSTGALSSHYYPRVEEIKQALHKEMRALEAIDCRITPGMTHVKTCIAARTVDNAIRWLDEIGPFDSDHETERKALNASCALNVLMDDVYINSVINQLPQEQRAPYLRATTHAINLSGYLGILDEKSPIIFLYNE